MIFVIILLSAFIAGVIIGVFKKPDAAKQARWLEEYEARLERKAAGKSGFGGDPRRIAILAGGWMMMHR